MNLKHIFDRIALPPTFNSDAVQEAIEQNIDEILRKNLSRFEYARAILSCSEMMQLPALHLMDHRVRLPKLEGEFSSDEAGRCRLRKAIRERLEKMLAINSHAGGRELIGEALGLKPETDAEHFGRAYEFSPKFVNLLLRGAIGSALQICENSDDDAHRDFEPNYLVRLSLIYHGALQIQLISARGRCIDRLFLRLVANSKALTSSGSLKQIKDVVSVIEHILRKLSRKTSQGPQKAWFNEMKPTAEEQKAKINRSDQEVANEAMAFLAEMEGRLSFILDKFKKKLNKGNSSSLHCAVFGLTSVQALYFASARIISFRDSLKLDQSGKLEFKNFSISHKKDSLPRLDNQDVAKLVFANRALTLRDDFAPRIFDKSARDINLKEAYDAISNGDVPGLSTFKETQKLVNSTQFFSRKLQIKGQGHLTDGAMVDLLPEFILQWHRRLFYGEILIDRVNRSRAKNKANIPHPTPRGRSFRPVTVHQP